MRIIARDANSGETFGHLDVVLSVATETDCQNCHQTGQMAADDAGIVWANQVDKEVESKINILILHDAEEGTQLEASQPVLCAQCPYSPALDLSGTDPAGDQIGKPNF